MIKWFLYIVFLMIFVPRLSSAKNITASYITVFHQYHVSISVNFALQQRDTSATKGSKQHPAEEDKKKIKEVAKAKKLPKPVKVEEEPKPKPKRQRRPDGLERPPEIPRRNNN
jgi:hypothetical protein